MAATSLSTLVTALMDMVGDTLTTGTVDSGSNTTIVDAARTESDHQWINKWVRIDTDAGGGSAAPEGEERRITAFTASSDTITVFPAFTAATGVGDTYSIREMFSYDQYKKAINHAIRMAAEWWPYIGWTYPITAAKITGTATSTTANSITDSSQSYTADDLIGRTVVIYEGTGAGQVRKILDNDTTKFVVSTWDVTPDTTSKFVIKKTGAAHIVVCTSQIDYYLPGGTKHIYEAWLEIPDTEESGTATSTTSTTLVDSGQSWTVDEHIGRYVVIYDGTGMGQPAKLITDNDATSVTVSGWEITPDTTSDYKIKNPTEPTSDVLSQDAPWRRITNAYPDIIGGYFRLQGQCTEGAFIRLKYETDPMELDSSSDTTDVPEDYILFKAAAFLWAKKKDSDARWWAQWYEQQAEKYAVTHRRRRPYSTLWGWDGVEVVHRYDSPFRPTS